MQNLFIAAKAVCPLFVMMSLGYAIRLWGNVSENGLKEMNYLIYKIFLPIFMFVSVVTIDIKNDLNLSLIINAVILTSVIFIIIFVTVPLFEKENARRGALIQGIFRSNFIIFGLTIATAIYGDRQLGAITLLSAILVPFMNALSVIALEAFRGSKINIKSTVLGILTHPLILAAAVALLMVFAGFMPSELIFSPLQTISKATMPLALIVIGASFQFKKIKGFYKQLFFGVAGRLILVPAICLPICILLGFRDVALVGLLVAFGGPCATSSLAMAQQMDADGELAGAMVVFTTALCVITIFLWVLLLGFMNML